MSFEIVGQKLGNLVAAADLSAKQYFGVKVDSAGKIALIAAAGELAIGILQNKPEAAQAAEVMVSGVSKGVASGAIAAGAKVAFDSAGKLKAAVLGKVDTSDAGAAADPLIGSHVIGILLEAAGADGDIVAVQMLHLGLVPTTSA